jgi:hypothetical protein
VKIFGVDLHQCSLKIISAFDDFGVYEKSGIKFEYLGDHTTCTNKSQNFEKSIKIDKKFKYDILKYCLRQKLGLRQLNYVSFVKKQVFTTRQSKISKKCALVKGPALAKMPYLVKSVGMVIIFRMSLQPVIVFDVYSFSGSSHW